jgi:uncharacterized small protein (DUF1192 family)
MIVSRSKMNSKITIDLSGPEGNAFFILSMVKELGKRIGMTKEEISKIQGEMMSSDYENLLKVFDREFGELVIMYR